MRPQAHSCAVHLQRARSARAHTHTHTHTHTRARTTHTRAQGLDNAAILKPVTKFTAEVPSVDCISEVVANAFRAAEMVGRPGAAFVSLPQVRRAQAAG